jgi:hypothetical protein
MGSKMTTEDLRLYKQIDEILYSEWNPIGVSDLPRDEYQSYLPKIFGLKKSGASSEIIAQTLSEYEEYILGMAGDIETCRLLAQKINNL